MQYFIRAFMFVAIVAGICVTAPTPAGATPVTVGDTTKANFDAGNLGDGLAVDDASDGAVTFSPGSANFNGNTLPDGWTFSGSGSANVTGGSLNLNGGVVTSPLTLGPIATLGFTATFTAANQEVGFKDATGLASGVAIGSGNGDGSLHLIKNGSSVASFGSQLLGAPHVFSLKWDAKYASITWLDYGSSGQTWVVSVDLPVSPDLRVYAGDVAADANELSVESLEAERWYAGTDFTESTYPENWMSGGGANPAPVFQNGAVTIKAFVVKSKGTIGPGTTVDFWADLGSVAGQSIGFSTTGTSSGNRIEIKTDLSPIVLKGIVTGASASSGSTSVTLGSAMPGVMHQYRIEWLADKVIFSVVDMPGIAPVVVNASLNSRLIPYLRGNSTTLPLVVDSVHATSMVNPGSDFASAPANWTDTPLSGGGTTFSSGTAVVNESRYGADKMNSAGHTFDFWANLSATAANQSIGWGQWLTGTQPRGVLTTSTGGQLLASNGTTTTAMPSSLLGASHHYQIEWTADNYIFRCLDVSCPEVTLPTTANTHLRPVINDTNTSGDSIIVDSMQVLPVLGGVSQSRVFDGTQALGWSTATWDATLPSNTGINVSIRAGNSATPDSSWGPWTSVPSSGATVSGVIGRYVQYKAQFAMVDEFATATLNSISITGDTLTPISFTDDLTTDFQSGAHQGTEVSTVDDGEVQLYRGGGGSIGGTLPPGWVDSPSGTLVSQSGGGMAIDGGYAHDSLTSFSAFNGAIEFDAISDMTQEQQFGVEAQDLSSGMFYHQKLFYLLVPSDGVYIGCQPEAASGFHTWTITKVGSFPMTGAHDYRIEWTPTLATFLVDGSWVGSLSPCGSKDMNPFIYDAPVANSIPLIINGAAYGAATNGAFTSRILGSGTATFAGPVTWTADVPSGTTLGVEVRTGNTSTPDGTWSSWSTITSGAILPALGKYIQYRLTLSGTASATPLFRDITFTGY